MCTTFPIKTHTAFIEFLEIFLNQPITPAKNLKQSAYDNDRQLMEILVKENSIYPKNFCWFNCLEHSLINGGSVICGWGFWQRGCAHYVAQHHAIWKSPTGDYIDLTPNNVSNTVLFMPDNRAPFDFHKLRCPFNFERIGATSEVWFAPGGFESKSFSIAVLQPTAIEMRRVLTIQQSAIQIGLI